MGTPFEGKVAIVTGGASGIGRALCMALCRGGAQVVVADIDIVAAAHLAGTLGHPARAARLDVTRADQVHQVVADTVAAFGRLDFMFNNAAATATRGEIGDIPLAAWQNAIDVNLLGVVHGTVAARAVMARQGAGHIVNIGSLAGLVGFPTSVPYGATKAAVVSLSVAARLEAVDTGVRVSVVCPGPVHDPRKPHLIGVDRAAEQILKGVVRNRAIIVFPLSARILWWLYRLCPWLVFPVGRKLVRDRRAQVPVGRPEVLAALAAGRPTGS